MAKGVKPVVRTDKDSFRRAPPVPAWLSAEAKKEWRRVMPLLIERRILTDADLAMVETFCVSAGRVREVEKLIQAAGGDIDPRLFRMQDKAAQTARLIASELGLTPVSRSRPTMRDDASEPEDDPLGL
ncbi:phage terminase small subunit P27 family [Methylocystis sp. S23]